MTAARCDDGVQQLRIVFAHRNRILLTVISRVEALFIHDGVVRVLLLPGAQGWRSRPYAGIFAGSARPGAGDIVRDSLYGSVYHAER